MYQIDLKRPEHIHFIGIGGISMSGLAHILLNAGFEVSGSDRAKSPLTDHLEKEGARICLCQSAENILPGTAAVIYSAAIHPDNPEYRAAAKAGIPLLSRAELLGQLMRSYETAIAVAGTHGKTTTTSMLSHILMEADTDPTISVGGILPLIGGNIRVGASGMFLTEACEYTNSFLSFAPTLAVILNMDADHLDFFKDIEDIRASFRRFALLLPEDGTLVINADTPCYTQITRDLPCRVLTYSLTGKADFTAADLQYNGQGHASFTALRSGEPILSVSLRVAGEHNVSNALAAIAASEALSLPRRAVAAGLSAFHGADRRLQFKGEVDGVTYIDDYAHHPTEIEATLKTLKQTARGELWCVFQPHTYSRTRALFDDFARALSLADHVILARIYAARETDTLGVSSEGLAEAVRERGTDCCALEDFAGIEAKLLKVLKPGDICLSMGAGDVFKVTDDLTEKK